MCIGGKEIRVPNQHFLRKTGRDLRQMLRGTEKQLAERSVSTRKGKLVNSGNGGLLVENIRQQLPKSFRVRKAAREGWVVILRNAQRPFYIFVFL